MYKTWQGALQTILTQCLPFRVLLNKYPPGGQFCTSGEDLATFKILCHEDNGTSSKTIIASAQNLARHSEGDRSPGRIVVDVEDIDTTSTTGQRGEVQVVGSDSGWRSKAVGNQEGKGGVRETAKVMLNVNTVDGRGEDGDLLPNKGWLEKTLQSVKSMLVRVQQVTLPKIVVSVVETATETVSAQVVAQRMRVVGNVEAGEDKTLGLSGSTRRGASPFFPTDEDFEPAAASFEDTDDSG
jgi:hypothetical protein